MNAEQLGHLAADLDTVVWVVCDFHGVDKTKLFDVSHNSEDYRSARSMYVLLGLMIGATFAQMVYHAGRRHCHNTIKHWYRAGVHRWNWATYRVALQIVVEHLRRVLARESIDVDYLQKAATGFAEERWRLMHAM